ncbi:MAG: stage II sporulation protein M [Anaerolineales bacterium]|jgi:uncharacterized membrane protein SpoIIM required for sporulation/ABC-type transport system involved in multi-copper enzyme maturation permease subunit
MLDSLRMALVITRREVRDQLRDWRIVLPIVILTLLFPSLMNFTAHEALNFVGQYGAPIIGERLIPFLMMVVGFFPISISLVIALESFVGEKERHSIEPLLTSPLSDGQLYLGKLLAAIVAPLLASYLGILAYLVGIHLQIGWNPPVDLLIQILALTTVQAILMVSGAVVISSQTTSVRAANLLASFIVIPVALLVQGESIVMFWGRYDILWWVIFGESLIAWLLMRMGISHFNREELLGHELDTLSFRWAWQVFKRDFIGEAHTPWAWYGLEVAPTVKSMLSPLFGMIILLIFAIAAGVSQASVFHLPLQSFNVNHLDQGIVRGMESLHLFTASDIATVWYHNLRAIVLATLLGFFSFGVLGLIVLMVPVMLIGYLLASISMIGFSPLLLFGALVLPHGIFEIPAILLSGAAILHMGATLATPSQGETVGESWLRSLADWAKIMIGVVLPLLLAAAFMEVIVTPRVAMMFLGGTFIP